MTVVVYDGYCPDCGRDVGAGGVTVYSYPPALRVVACTCGSRRIPVALAVPIQRGART